MNEIKNAAIAFFTIKNNKINRLLILQLAYGRYNYYWWTPGGKLNENEDPYIGAKREFKEEVGVKIDETKILKIGYVDSDNTRIFWILSRQKFFWVNLQKMEIRKHHFKKIDIPFLKHIFSWEKYFYISKYGNVECEMTNYSKKSLQKIFLNIFFNWI